MMILPSLLHQGLPAHGKESMENGAALAADLNLTRVLSAMAQGDPFVRKVSGEVLLSRDMPGIGAIRFRQEILADFLGSPTLCRGLYEALSTGIDRYETYLGKSLPSFSTFITASAVIKDRIILFKTLYDCVIKTRDIIRQGGQSLTSAGVCACFRAFIGFFSDDFLSDSLELLNEIESACENMYARISAGLGLGLKGDRYVLQAVTDDRSRKSGSSHSQAKSGEIGLSNIGIQAQAGKLRDAALSQISHVLKQVNESTLACLKTLRYELAFYLGGVNLRGKLDAIGVPTCFPAPVDAGCEALAFDSLVDIGLAIENARCPVGNTFQFDSCRLLVVTGANQGGKSTFIRSVGCAELMMRCGLIVAAKAYTGGLCTKLYTHFCRPESVKPDQGRLNEELGRMDDIVAHIDRESLVLMNESFSTTSEREASAIAGEVLQAFYDLGIRAVYVTHFYEFARVMEEKKLDGVKFLVAQRNPDGTRPYTLAQAQPRHTSFALDIYREVFGA